MEDGSDKEENRDCPRGIAIAGSRKQSSRAVDRSMEDLAGFNLSSPPPVTLEELVGPPA